MTSTNYYIVHKSGRRIKITCVGYCHSDEMKKDTIKMFARIEHARPQDYTIEEEKKGDAKVRSKPQYETL